MNRHLVDFSLLTRNRDFALIYSGIMVSWTGTMLTNVAVPYQVYHETHSTLMVGLVSLFQLIPLLFTALWGGVLADRYSRRTLIFLSQGGLLLGSLLLVFNAAFEHANLWIIFIASAWMSALSGVSRPASSGLLQQLIAAEDYATMGALIGVGSSICMILGPAMAGLIIDQFGIVTAFSLDLLSFIFGILVFIPVRRVAMPVINATESIWSSLKSGIRYAGSRQELLGTYFVDFVAMIFGMPNALFPAIAQSLGGAKTLGLLYAAPAVGALVFSCFSGFASRVKRQGQAVAVAAIFWGICIVGFGCFRNSLWISLFFLALAGGADAVSGIFRSAMWNNTIPNELRSRLAGIEMISYLSGPKLGDTESGMVAAAFGVGFSIISGGVLCVIGVGICCYFLPKFWRYRG